MSRRTSVATLMLIAALAVFLLTPFGQVVSRDVSRVLVTNFPGIQNVEGTVEVKGTIRVAELVTFENITVPPVKPSDTTRLVEAGTLVTDGFPEVVLSLHGVVRGSALKHGEVGAILIPDQHVVRGSALKHGEVGAILIPDQQQIQEAFDEQGFFHFALRAAAHDVSSKTPYFASDQPKYTVGFENYKVLLYNTTDKTVSVNLFAYLTN